MIFATAPQQPRSWQLEIIINGSKTQSFTMIFCYSATTTLQLGARKHRNWNQNPIIYDDFATAPQQPCSWQLENIANCPKTQSLTMIFATTSQLWEKSNFYKLI